MAQTQPDFSIEDKAGRSGPNSELDIYDQVVNPEVSDDIVQNLGLGNYSDREYWQQMESFKQGMFAEAALERPLWEQAIEEAIFELGKQGRRYFDQRKEEEVVQAGWEDWSEQKQQRKCGPRDSRVETIRKRGAHIWQILPDEEKPEVLEEYVGTTAAFHAPHWRMVEARHEGSKSREARLIDNLFSRVTEVKGDAAKKAKRTMSALRGGK